MNTCTTQINTLTQSQLTMMNSNIHTDRYSETLSTDDDI